MTSPLNVTAEELHAVVRDGHVLLIDELGRVRADIPEVEGDLPSQQAMRDAHAVNSAELGAQIAEAQGHADKLKAAANGYTKAEADNAGALSPKDAVEINKGVMSMLTGGIKDVEGAVSDAGKNLTAMGTGTLQAVSAAGGPIASSIASMGATLVPKAVPAVGTPAAAAPAAGEHKDDKQEGEQRDDHAKSAAPARLALADRGR